MNDSSDIENMLRSLHPHDLPGDLKRRLDTPPTRRSRPAAWRHTLTAASAAAAAACLAWFLPKFSLQSGSDSFSHHPATTAIPTSAPLAVHHSESTLIDSHSLGFLQRDGRMWSIEEQQWQDDEIACCSNSPVRVHQTSSRREVVCEPVRFD